MSSYDIHLYSGVKILHEGWGLGPTKYYSCGSVTAGHNHERLWSTIGDSDMDGYPGEYSNAVMSSSQ